MDEVFYLLTPKERDDMAIFIMQYAEMKKRRPLFAWVYLRAWRVVSVWVMTWQAWQRSQSSR